jgi:hypothetical protein
LDIKQHHGVYRAVVQDVKDPANQRRIRVIIPQITGNESTGWIWPVEPYGIKLPPPSVGQGVWVSYLGGDPEHPVYHGAFGKHLANSKPYYIEPLSNNVDLTGISNVIVTKTMPDSTVVVDLTQTLLNIATARFYCGAFEDTTTQTAASTTTAYPITLNTDDVTNYGVKRGSTTSQIIVAYSGVYNLQFSVQLDSTSSSYEDVSIWIRKNGVDIPGSTGLISVPPKHAGSNGHGIFGWNYFVTADKANDYFELYWSTSNSAVTIASYAAGTGPTRPSTASVVLTIEKVR